MFVFIQHDAHGREAGWVPLERSSQMAREMAPKASSPPRSTAKTQKSRKKTSPPPAAKNRDSVYDGQPVVREAELYEFLELLPRFRSWAKKQGEEAHPILNEKGNPDFLYSSATAKWVAGNGFDPARFFCVMGRMAAALTIVAEGNDSADKPNDMPKVDASELDLARKHLGELLAAGGTPEPLK